MKATIKKVLSVDNVKEIPELITRISPKQNEQLQVYFREQDGPDYVKHDFTNMLLENAAKKESQGAFEIETLMHIVGCLYGDKYDLDY